MTKIEVTKTELVWPGKYNETPKEVLKMNISDKRKELSVTLQERKSFLEGFIVWAESELRLRAYPSLVRSLRAGNEPPGEHLVTKRVLPSPLSLLSQSGLFENREFVTRPTLDARIAEAQREIKEIDEWLTDILEGELDGILNDLLRKMREETPMLPAPKNGD